MVDDNDNLAMYESVDEAKKAGEENILGCAYGFEIFELGYGV